MRKCLIPVAALIALCMAAPVAVASNHPEIDQCKVTVSGDKINVNGSAKNLDKKKAIVVILILQGRITGDCINPGGNSPPGQANKEVDFEETRTDQFGKGLKNIFFHFNVTPFVSAGDVCPNPNWSFKIKKIKLFSVVVKVIQNQKVVATRQCL